MKVQLTFFMQLGWLTIHEVSTKLLILFVNTTFVIFIVFSPEYSKEYEPICDDKYQKLNHASEDDITFEIYGYRKNKIKTLLFHSVSLFFFGIPYLLATWYKQVKLIKFRKCLLKEADFLYGMYLFF